MNDYDHYVIDGQLVDLTVADPHDIEILKMVVGSPFRFMFSQDMMDLKDDGYLVESIEAQPDGSYRAKARSAAWRELVRDP
jgi:hypothetical protein